MTQMIEAKIDQLSEELQREVLDYIDFLLQKYPDHPGKKQGFRFDWEGGLSGLTTRFSSVELQHQAAEWRACI